MTDAVVFLDIDGVCNDLDFVRRACSERPLVTAWDADLARRTLDPARVARVQAVCDRAGATVVIVSGWRRWAPADELSAILRDAGLTAPILGAVGGVRFSGDLRATATHEWLSDHPEVTRWVVIDDTDWLWRGPWLVGRVVVPVDGITDEDVARAVEVLGSPVEP